MTKPGRPRQRTCARGHRLTGENVYAHADGSRECLTCKRDRQRKLRADPIYRAAENDRRRRYYAERYANDPDFRKAETKRRQAYRKRKEAEHG
jgi:hypothetical protein